MRGHHIYTSSWFKYGSNSKNPGTYTVELTRDIFGSDTDDVIFKLNQMCSSVPESLAPRNTNESVLRIYHILPDTTVVSRSWFVTDEITGRGTVPYTHSLLFRGDDNERFLRYPSKAYEISSVEPYKSYKGRVSTDAPTELSTKYDPRKEDYKEPFVFSKNEWIADFGLDEDLFAKYYISLGRAVCVKGNTRVAVILRKNMDSEKLILATLSILPMFMKRKFAAASKWTGMMDGSGSNAVNGIQLLCYYDESPVSESGFPVIDLTGAGRHANIAVPTFTETELNYARWIWRNIDESKKLSEYENFIELTFSSVLDKIPFVVVANSFFLWVNRNVDTYEVARKGLVLIARSFAKNFAKFEFINKSLDKAINKLLENVQVSDYDSEKVQAVCLLATNGSASAKKLVDALFVAFKDEQCWDRLAIVLQYYKSVLELTAERTTTERATAIGNLWSCLNLSDKSKECVRIAFEPLRIHCQNLREIILTSKEKSKSDEAFSNYKKLSESLNKFNLPNTFFQLKDIPEINTIDAERFFELEKFDVGTLAYIPSTQHWVKAINWAANLAVERRSGLWYLYWDTIKNKGEYIIALEKAAKINPNGQNRVLAELIRSSVNVEKEIANYYKEDFASKWNAATYPLDSDETWKYMKEWLERLRKVRLIEQSVLEYIHELIGLTKDNIDKLAERLSRESFQTAASLYNNVESLKVLLQEINEVDLSAAERGDKYFSGLANKIKNGSISPISINRMLYWHSINPNAPAEWAFVIALARNGSKSIYVVDYYLELRQSKTNAAAGIAEVLELFKIVSIATDYKNPYKNEATSITDITDSVRNRLQRIDKEYYEKIDVRFAFRNLPDSEHKDRIASTVYDVLDKRVDEAIRSEYRPKRFKHSYVLIESDDYILDPTVLCILVVFLATIAGAGFFSFCKGIAIIGEVSVESIALILSYILGGEVTALILPYMLTVLIIIATILSARRILRNGGNQL